MTGPQDEELHAALRYALAGWPVFPCKRRLKVPAIPAAHPLQHPCRGECGREGHGFHDATTDPDVIRAWWARWPRANIGIATGAPGPDVLDVDARPNGNGWAALNRLKRAGLLTGARALVRTRSGGLHVYFAGTAQPCGRLTRHHLDFKAGGGYVLAPPSFVEADKNGPAGTYELLDHQAGTAALDWAKVTALLEPPRPRRTMRPASPLPPGEIPASVRRALEAPAEDRSAAMHRLIGACLRAGMDDQAIHNLAASYEPAVSKYGDRLHAEVDRSMERIGAALVTAIPSRLADLAPDPDPVPIEVGTGPVTIRALRQALNAGEIPGTYVSSGRVVCVERVSGTPGATAGDEDSPLPVTASEVRSPELAALLAANTYTFRRRPGKDDAGNPKLLKEEVTPPTAVLAAALAPKEWPGLRPLFGIVGAPVLRPDGTLLQTPGYDPATSLYLASKVPLDPVPERPSRDQVKAARRFLLTKFLGDFPWVSEADRANYVGLLVTPILRSYLRTLIPFGVVTSTMPGSGKTILTCGLGMLYGQRVLTWTHSDEELRKAITSVLSDPAGTVIFDNLAEGTVIDSPVLARLITDRTWADRLLGKNTVAALQNDRVWTATGNNLRLGGDMRTRSVLVSLNPNMPRPEERTGFAIPNLDQWILMAGNQRTVLWHLLVLVADWTHNGAPRQDGLTMRQFTLWAEAVGGFLRHHGIAGFLANVETVRDIDEEEATWTAFFAQWRKIHGSQWLTSNQLWLSADSPHDLPDQWDGCFITDARGRLPSIKSLGKLLTGQIDRFRGSYVLRSAVESHGKVRTWCVEEWSG